MSPAPKQNQNKTNVLDNFRTAELTLKTRQETHEEVKVQHIQVSHEYLGGRFDIKG